MIFIGYDYDGYVISIVNAKSKDLAIAYWQGAGMYPNTIVEDDCNGLKDHPTGVYPLIKIKTVKVRSIGGAEIITRQVQRG